MDYRIERDTIGEMKVPSDKYWGAQTQRSFQNFPIGDEKMPVEIINGFAILKKVQLEQMNNSDCLIPSKRMRSHMLQIEF